MSKIGQKKSILRRVRIFVAAAVFIAFILTFLNVGGVCAKALGWLPSLQFWPALAASNLAVLILIIVLTMIFGRAYCSFLCPLGIMQDGIWRFNTAVRHGRPAKKWKNPGKWVRYIVPAAFLAAICAGYGSFAYILEPYSLFGMMVTSFLGRSLTVAAVSLAFFAVIAFLVWKSGRVWCNSVCPVGAILGIFARRSLMRPVFDTDKCIACGLCGRKCRASCIDVKNHSVDMSRCVVCFDCIDNCSEGAIGYGWSAGRRKSDAPATGNSPVKADLPDSGTIPDAVEDSASESAGQETVADSGRRAFLSTAALTVGAVAAKAGENLLGGNLMPLMKKIPPQRAVPLIPPGASSLKVYESKCIGCQLCVSACPSKLLRPGMDLKGLLFQPVMGFEHGFCRPECTACSDVCPTDALKRVTKEEKSSISIGYAVYSPWSCVIMTDSVSCGNCARHCPTGAITMVPQTGGFAFGSGGGPEIPSVDTSRCIGCGRCEYVCPVRPVSAIYVEGNETHRKI